MTRLDRIEQDVASLSPEDLARFRAWFARHDAARFDERIEADATSGRLAPLADEALREFRAGRAKPL
ncbi:hypothetical protein ASG43_12405 [Aureimonas sp. Leaf454]|uniref:hypothetical protein n=1 Tax=Aureimonas sp. Leaf454 TaxID=1736381 RepID=UPI0006F83868|nr:hypothetical protein [Aureimonas sp. Leaf454]KQT45101.1 hypothetical protein ASG43_12405 [Aureimonas sp. Leaf454]